MQSVCKRFLPFFFLALLTLLFPAFSPGPALAHCDGLDGPVVNAARMALQAGDPNLVLVWVQEKDGAEIRRAFDRTLKLRKLSTEARDLADTYFFETLVRIHRAGEGAPYDGLKPAGRDLGPAIPAADQALVAGDLEPLVKILVAGMEEGLRERFAKANGLKNYRKSDVEAGRKYVAAYVTYLHYAEGLHAASASAAHGHFEETPEKEAEAPAGGSGHHHE